MKNILTTLKIYLLLISIFMFFRIILFIANWSKVADADGDINWINVFLSFFMGLRFDVVVSGYLLLLFFLIISIVDFSGRKFKIVVRLLFYYLMAAVTLALILSAADIPYFNQFYSRINAVALQWIDSPVFIFKMIIQEPRYYLIALPLVLALIIFYKILKKIFKSHNQNNFSKPNTAFHILFSILFLLLMFLGIRGRIEIKSPIRIGTAYFCNNSFLNQAGLNPVFTFMTSYLDRINPKNQYLNLMNDELAVKKCSKIFQHKK